MPNISTVLAVVSLANLLLFRGVANAQQNDTPDTITSYRATAAKLIEAGSVGTSALERVAALCDRFGPRLSGSTNLEAALDWVLAELRRDGFENVHPEPVMVPRWVRGSESLELVTPRATPLRVLGLGGSIGTAPEGLNAEVLVVRSFSELRGRSAAAKGKIVLFNVPFTTYGETVAIRSQGAIEAAKAGAVGSLIRSVTPHSLYTPHTGMMAYDDALPRIPHAAITVEDAEMLDRFQTRGEKITVRLRMEARTMPDAPSRNIIAEIRGREFPDECVVVGGHIDSWDVGQGAIDDGGGCIASWQALLLVHKLNLRPRRTIRLVLWVNEENGLRGANAYRDAHAAELATHVLAVESDEGVARPRGFAFTGNEQAAALLRGIVRLCEPLGAAELTLGSGGTDLIPLQHEKVPTMGLVTDPTKYFWYHHSNADTVDKVDGSELNQCATALAIMCYTVADLPARLPR